MRRADPARLQELLDPGAPAGLPSQGGDDGQGLFVPLSRSTRWAISAWASRRNFGGRRPIRYKSSLNGVTSADLAKNYETATGRQWNGAVGYVHSLFEVAADVIKRAKDPTDKASLRDAIIATDLDTTVGHINWKNGPMKNVCKTPLVAGQWVKGEKHPFDLIVVANTEAADIPVAKKPIAIPY